MFEQNNEHSVYESQASDCQNEREVTNREREKASMTPVVLGWNQKYQYDAIFFKYVCRLIDKEIHVRVSTWVITHTYIS